ncbi:protein POLLENLESS 3-like isoform X2 [Nymphaea colorata]|uniref:protein POLLENLESS 3-like isoform X2 n=1 Tax=Nymphaea colorata TaxID=210225 RepID=UPI00129E78EB|nr:protein POLLENLESS 3-like isoform X2 [Nymphaea colorata]
MEYAAHKTVPRWKPPQRRIPTSAPATPDIRATTIKNACVSPEFKRVRSRDSPYIKAKDAQLIDKDLNKAVPLFWNAINSGDHVESALKDMVVVMKQLNRAEEGIEAIKSFRSLCSSESQDSLDNLLIDLYKKCGRPDEQIELLQYKLKMLKENCALLGKQKKLIRSQGKRFYITTEQEESRLLGNLAWAYLQQGNYRQAEGLYRQALRLEPDDNKKCNLAICLMQKGETEEAKFLVQSVISGLSSSPEDASAFPKSCLKSLERACQMLDDTELLSSAITQKPAKNELGHHHPVHGNEEKIKDSLHSGNCSYLYDEHEEASRAHTLSHLNNWNHNFEGELLSVSSYRQGIPTHNLNSEDFESENWNPNVQLQPKFTGHLESCHLELSAREHVRNIFSSPPNTETRHSSVKWENKPACCSLKPKLIEFPRRRAVSRSLSSQLSSCIIDENKKSEPKWDHIYEHFFLPANLFDVTP